MKKARVVNNIAYDVIDGDVNDFFHPTIAAQFVDVPDEVENGWEFDGTDWNAPNVQPPLQPQVGKSIDIPGFLLLFTHQERIKARELRATDAIINDFWLILDDPRTLNVNLSLTSIQGAIEHTLTQINANGVTIDVQLRKSQILDCVIQ